MAFLNAVAELGDLENQSGFESYLTLPLDREGRVIRVFLDIANPDNSPLDVKGVLKVDLADFKIDPAMKNKYLFRQKVSNSANWGFSPLMRLGKLKASIEKNREAFKSQDGNWEKDKKSHFYKLKYNLLDTYEAEEIFSKGSVDRIMDGLEEKIEDILPDLDNKNSYIIIFGGIKYDGTFLYPGEIPAFVAYFQQKIERHVLGDKNQKKKRLEQEEDAKRCFLCGAQTTSASNINKVFKFATYDKLSIFPALDKNEGPFIAPICTPCLEKLSSGRDKIERNLSNKTILQGLDIWVVPEAVNVANKEEISKHLIYLLKAFEQKFDEKIEGLGEKAEERYFSRLAQEGEGLVFHFLFLEKNQSQELLHLMVEDVPPERLSLLEELWRQTVKKVIGGETKEERMSLDSALRSLFWVFNSLSGKGSKGDKEVFKGLILVIIGKMLQGERLPIRMLKEFVVSRIPYLIYEGNKGGEAVRTMLYSQCWVEYMYAVNKAIEEGTF